MYKTLYVHVLYPAYNYIVIVGKIKLYTHVYNFLYIIIIPAPYIWLQTTILECTKRAL